MKKIRVVAADDSLVMRGMLQRMFDAPAARTGAFHFELVAAMADGAACLHTVRSVQPDAVLMDLHMPGMNGLETVQALRREWPQLPIVMCSTYTAQGAAETLEALARGASDYVTKPKAGGSLDSAIAALWKQLAPKLQALVCAPVLARNMAPAPDLPAPGLAAMPGSARRGGAIAAVVIGVSTGGPAALEALLSRLPADFGAPILIVQHMPPLFTQALADRLDRCCALPVRQAAHGVRVQAGEVWLAPGDRHMEVTAGTSGLPELALHNGEPVQHCRPAADLLFRSAAQVFGNGVLAVVMTGMGSDGLEGARAVVRAGGNVLAQDRESSAVWGMPGRVCEMGLAQICLPLQALAAEIVARFRTGVPARMAMGQGELVRGAA